jgi:hypothetical protein
MAQTLEQIIETHLKVIDAATGPLAKIAAQAEKTAAGLDHAGKAAAHGGEAGGGAFGHLFGILQGMAGISAVVGAGLSLHAAIESTEKYMNNLKEVSNLTGAAVSQTDLLFSSARRSGVAYDAMSQTMFQLSRRGAMLATTQAAAAGKVPGLAKKFEALGVNLKKGPVESLIAMSDAVKKGKIGAGELMGQFKIPQREANNMEEFLRKLDPKKLRAAKAGGKGLIGDTEMDAFKRIESAQNRISDTWNRIKVTVISKLYPIVADMAERFADRLEGFLPKLEDAMSWVAAHMDSIVIAAKAFVLVMTGKKMLDMVASLTSPAGMLGKMAAGGPFGAMGKKAAGKAAEGDIGGQLKVLAAAGPMLLAIGAAVAIAALAFRGFSENIGGARDALMELWDKFKAKIDIITEAVGRLFGAADAGTGTLDTLTNMATSLVLAIFEIVDTAVSGWVLMGYAIGELGSMADEFFKQFPLALKQNVYDPFLKMLTAIGGVIVELMKGNYIEAALQAKKAYDAAMQVHNPAFLAISTAADALGSGLERATAKYQKDVNAGTARNKAQREADAKKEKNKEDTKPSKQEMNFPNARFDITQNFAEGFDPDRIAVAFANDISSLGEMRSSSTYTNALNGVR